MFSAYEKECQTTHNYIYSFIKSFRNDDYYSFIEINKKYDSKIVDMFEKYNIARFSNYHYLINANRSYLRLLVSGERMFTVNIESVVDSNIIEKFKDECYHHEVHQGHKKKSKIVNFPKLIDKYKEYSLIADTFAPEKIIDITKLFKKYEELYNESIIEDIIK